MSSPEGFTIQNSAPQVGNEIRGSRKLSYQRTFGTLPNNDELAPGLQTLEGHGSGMTYETKWPRDRWQALKLVCWARLLWFAEELNSKATPRHGRAGQEALRDNQQRR